MWRFLRRLGRRQQRFAYLVIALMLSSLAVTIGQRFGWPVAVSFFVLFLMLLEVLYQQSRRLIVRNRHKWWARRRSGSAVFGIYLPAALIVMTVLIESPFVRYSLLALLVAGAICAGAIGFMQRRDQL
jgi:hypothetical protein